MASNTSHNLAHAKLFDVSQLTAVVSGGGTGIGLMIAQALVTNGAKVYIVGRRKEALDSVVKQYSDHGPGQLIALPGDISDKGDLEKMAQEVGEKEPKGIHLLVNNAGVALDDATKFSSAGKPDFSSATSIQSHFWKSSPESWADTYKINVTGHFYTSLAFLPLLEKGRNVTPGYTSSIVNVASISGVMKGTSMGQFAYACSKAASIHLTRMLASTLVETKIRCNCIAPGIFPSEMTTGESGDDQKSKIDRQVGNPAGRPGKDEDMAACILFLAGPGGLFLNSQVVYPDGGSILVNPAAT